LLVSGRTERQIRLPEQAVIVDDAVADGEHVG
jgi:hypothetical protein